MARTYVNKVECNFCGRSEEISLQDAEEGATLEGATAEWGSEYVFGEDVCPSCAQVIRIEVSRTVSDTIEAIRQARTA